MARVMAILLLLLNVALGAWLWHDFRRPEPDFSARERNPEAVRIVSAVPPSEGAARAASRGAEAGALSGAACVAIAGLSPDEIVGVREAVAGLGLGERVRELGGATTTGTSGFIFLGPDAALLAWLGRLKRGLDAARLERVECPAPVNAPVTPPAPPGGRR